MAATKTELMTDIRAALVAAGRTSTHFVEGATDLDPICGGVAQFVADNAGAGGATVGSTAPQNVKKQTAGPGVSAEAARVDHLHQIDTAAAVSITNANAEGTSTSLARADHTHDHGSQTSGTMHAAVVAAGTSGFMTGADKTILDDLASWVGRAILNVSAVALTRDGANNALTQITHGSAYINLVRMSGLAATAVYSSNVACPNPWMAAGDFDGQIVILHNIHGAAINVQINTTALPNVRLESNTTKSVTPRDYISFIWDATGSRWDQLTSIILLT